MDNPCRRAGIGAVERPRVHLTIAAVHKVVERDLEMGKPVMSSCAEAAIASRPFAGRPPLIVLDPSGAKNDATAPASRLHHAAEYSSAMLRTVARLVRGLPIE